jgi:general secretion pathway protein D
MPRILLGCFATALACCTGLSSAHAQSNSIGIMLASATVGQAAETDDPQLTRLKVVDLLKRARQAMNEGNYETADSLISRAEAMKVKFPRLYIGDKPEKVRKDWERLTRTKAGQVQRPSQTATPSVPGESLEKKPTSGSLFFDKEPPASDMNTRLNDPKRQAQGYLLKGRSELAQGNTAGALHWVDKAAETGIQFGPDEDSPEKLAADIQRAGGKTPNAAIVNPSPPSDATIPGRSNFPSSAPFAKGAINAPPASDVAPSFIERATLPPAAPTQDLARQPATNQAMNDPAVASQTQTAAPTSDADGRRNQSSTLLLNARRALAVGDVRRANESIAQARALQLTYDFHEDNPAKVEASVARYVDLTQRDAREKATDSYRHRYAELQMQQAEELLRWRDFDEAERLVNEAKRMGLNYGPFEAQPDSLLARISDGRRQHGQPRLQKLPPVGESSASPNLAGMGEPMNANPNDKKARALELVKQARLALRAGDMLQAERFAKDAESLQIPDSAFSKQDDRAWLVLLEIQKERRRSGVVSAQAVMPIDAGSVPGGANTAAAAVYVEGNDTTYNTPASGQQPIPPGPVRQAGPAYQPAQGQQPNAQQPGPLPTDGQPSVGMALFLQGEEALRQRDVKNAIALFTEAQAHSNELDPVTVQRLQDRLQLVAQPPAMLRTNPSEGALMKEAASAQALKYRQLSADVARQEGQAKQLRETDTRKAQAILQQARATVEKAQLETSTRDMLLRRVDRDLEELKKYAEINQGKMELQDRNDAVRKEIDREAKTKVEVQEKLALLVDDFNKLIDERRFDEAEIVAKKAKELAPNEMVVVQINNQAKFIRATKNSEDIRERKNDGFVKALESVEESLVPFDDRNPYVFPDLKDWNTLTNRRLSRLAAEHRSHRSEKEIEIEQRLKTQVSLRFREAPLSAVMDNLAKLAQVNLHLDPRGLAEEGVATDTPVTIDLSQEISLKSALVLILEPLHLSYVIKDEVLKITSEQLRDGAVYPVTYSVADLVIPIPNFVPNGGMGISGALRDAHASLGVGGAMGGGGAMPVLAQSNSASNALLDPKILGQFNLPNANGGGGMGGMNTGTQSGTNQPFGFGPGGAGGGVQPDFDSLIELITATIAPTTWSDVGGAGAIKQFATNLSLVISQTQEVHEEIADLLEQLRRLQDLQVTIEVRFITLQDNFYERMGIDFDLNINSNANKPYQIFGQTNPADTTFIPGTSTANGGGPVDINAGRVLTNAVQITQPSQSVTVGLSSAGTGGNLGTFSQDLMIPFRQTSFQQAGNLNPNIVGPAGILGGANLGFAILSDLEAYFFISAVQSDIRTNVMQSPKVTLFNGQQAFVSDTTQSPFVISVIPVVGDFAAAQQPVIVVLSEGTALTVQAVVSSDRRFVRLTVVPFFSSIGQVNTFTFTGASSSAASTSSAGPTSGTTIANNTTAAATQEGTTVQLPEFAFTTVTTTVSVPDGGTVLLGGIKRLSEERNENGVPILSKLPYINRLFDNIATARATSSLMMMVTPRIIIQEEEEALLGVQPNAP